MNNPTRYAALVCKNHGTVYIGFKEYVSQLSNPDRKWVCPSCGQDAVFDDKYFDKMHPDDPLDTTQERSKLEHTYTHEDVKEFVLYATAYIEALQNAIMLLGTPHSKQATNKVEAIVPFYLEAMRPFQHLRIKNEN
jgi:hypothetical protein